MRLVPLAGPRSSEVIGRRTDQKPASAAGTTMDRSLAGPVQLAPC